MPAGRKRIAIVLHRVENQPWGAMVKEDLENTLAGRSELSAEIVDPKGQSEKQIQFLNDFLKAQVDALIVFPLDAERVRPILREYKKAGIPVIVLANDPGDRELYRTLIIADHRQYGRAVGKFFVESMDGEGEVVEICGMLSSRGTAERSAGFREAIATTPGIQIVDQCNGEWLYDLAKKEFSEVLSRRKKIDGVFAHNDEMARGVWEAAQAAGRDKEMLITGIDAIRGERGIQMVVQGQLAATFINPSPAKAAIEALETVLAGGTCLPRRLLHTSPLRSNECIRAWQERRKR